MQSKSNRNVLKVLVAALLVAPVLSGCFSDEAPKPDGPADGVTVKAPQGSGAPAPTQVIKDHSGAKNEPAAHYHHYWGELESVAIYDGDVPFRNLNNKYPTTLAWSIFNLETDKDDVALDEPNVSPVTAEGKADTVFAGTSHIDVIFPDNFPSGLGAFVFRYKPSNTPRYLPEDGIIVRPSDVVTIQLDEVGMADPPHQFAASRWSFQLWGLNAQCEQFGLNDAGLCPPAFIQEASALQPDAEYLMPGLRMVAYNGGENFLDPPHPNFWTAGDKISLGRAVGAVDSQTPIVQTPLVRERAASLTGISMPPNNIVPLGTERVEVRVKWTNTAATAPTDGPAGDFFMQLRYHGADSIEYVLPEPTTALGANPTVDGEWFVYQLYDPSGAMVDPPYESNSFWRFELVPTTKIGDTTYYNTGVFQGTYEMEFYAYKVPGYILE